MIQPAISPVKLKYLLAKRWLCTLVFTSVLFPIHANELQDLGGDLFTLDLNQLMDLRVTTTSKREESHLQTPAMLTVVSAKEIDLLGFTSTEQVIEYLTGMSSVNGEGNVFTTTTILGNTLVNYNTNTLLLFDGKSLTSPYHGSFDFSAIPLSAIERIEIVKGANSVLYGTNAINAVINVISKASTHNEAEPLTGLVAQVGGNSQASLQLGYTTETLAAYVDVTETGGETLNLVDESANTQTIDPNKKSTSTNLQYRFGKTSISAIYFSRQQDNYRTKGFNDFQQNHEKGWSLSADHQFKLRKNQNINVSLQQYNWYLDKEFTVFSNGDQYTWEYEAQRTTAEVEYDIQLDDHSIILGSQWSQSIGRRYKGNTGAFDIGRYDEPTTDIALYANGDSKLTDSVRLYYGTRYFESNFKDESQDRDISIDNVSFRGALVKQLKNNKSVKFISAQAFRVPTYFEKQVSSATVQGNADLKPEESLSNIFVYSQLFEFGVLDVSIYQTEITNKITRVPTVSDPNIFENSNVGKIAFTGSELNFNFNRQGKVYGFAGISYNQNDDDTFENYFEWMASGAVSYKLSKKRSVGVSAKYLSDWGDADAYLILNPHYNHQINKDTELRLGVENAADSERTLPEIGRNKDSVPTIPVAHERNVYLRLRASF